LQAVALQNGGVAAVGTHVSQCLIEGTYDLPTLWVIAPHQNMQR
jgi:hypothetical protein